MALTEMACRQAKAREKIYKLYDAKNLYLEVPPSGSKRWRLRIRLPDKETRISLGLYPEVSLKDARVKRDEVLKNIKEYGSATPAVRAQSTAFGAVAAEWFSKQRPSWVDKHAKTVEYRLDKYILPFLADIDINAVSVPLLRALLDVPVKQGTIETAKRVRAIISQVFDYAIIADIAQANPAMALSKLIPSVRPVSFSTIVDPRGIGALLQAIDGYKGQVYVKIALQIAPYVFVRPGELRHAEWLEFDMSEKLWRIPAEKMKAGQEHLVPLADQVITLLAALRGITGNGRYLFPSARTLDRPISDNTLNSALKRMGYTSDDIVPHGFRSMASTRLNEMGERPDLIEKQLAHVEKDRVRSAYNRAEYLQERREMMQRWADYLDMVKRGC